MQRNSLVGCARDLSQQFSVKLGRRDIEREFKVRGIAVPAALTEASKLIADMREWRVARNAEARSRTYLSWDDPDVGALLDGAPMSDGDTDYVVKFVAGRWSFTPMRGSRIAMELP